MNNGNKEGHKSPLAFISFVLIAVGIVLVLGLDKLGNGENEESQKEEDVRTPDLTELNQMLDEYEQSEKVLEGFINGHEYVDLGLPSGIKWATCNIGASSREEAGELFAFGELVTKERFTEANCEICGKDNQWLLKNGYITEDGNLSPTHDIATQRWGGTWRTPTKEEIEELLTCTIEWGQINKTTGCRVKGKTNDMMIFIPAENFYEGSIWSSTPNKDDPDFAYYFCFSPVNAYLNESFRDLGRCILPVSE